MAAIAPRLAIVVAMAKNRTIGINNTLPWRCPEDLKHFKALTLGHHLIMGRKTWDSIGRPLPGRTTIVVTRNPDWHAEGCLVAHSLDEAIALSGTDETAFIVGGGELYAQAMARVDTLHVTEIQQEIEGDAHFPAIDKNVWQETRRSPSQQTSPHPLNYAFVTYQKRR